MVEVKVRHVHPSFATPLGSTRLWRYLQTSKFLEMLQSRTLWFSRSDYLGDPFEGSITTPSYQAERLAAGNEATELASTAGRKAAARNMYINCWHMNEKESAAMWQIYAPNQDSVAIVTSYEKLQGLLPNWLYLGLVKYIDYDTDNFVLGNLFNPFMHKRSSFAHEAELRAVLWDVIGFIKDMGNTPSEITEDQQAALNCLRNFGASVPIKLEHLIEEIFVSPSSPSWYRVVVEKAARDAGLICPVKQSSLIGQALF